MDWLKDITIEDMPTPDMEMVAHVCGLETAAQLLRSFAGCRLKIPKLWYMTVVRRKIIQEFDGKNINQLTERFGVSRRFIYKVLQEQKRDQQAGDRRGGNGGSGACAMPSGAGEVPGIKIDR